MIAETEAPEGPAPTGASSRSDSDAVIIETLTKRADFVAARNGAKAHAPAYVLQLHSRNDGTCTIRVGYTVTRKVGNAVVRNRIKRRLRAAVAQASWPADAAGHDVVLVARIEAMEAGFSDLVATLEQNLAHALRRIGRGHEEGGRRGARRSGNRPPGGVAKRGPTGQKPA